MLSCAAWGKASLIRTDWAKKDFYFHTSHSHYVSPYRRRYKEFFFPFNHLETQDYVIYVMSGTIFPTSRGEKKNHFERAGLESRSSCLAVDLSNHLTTAPRSMDIMINSYTVFVIQRFWKKVFKTKRDSQGFPPAFEVAQKLIYENSPSQRLNIWVIGTMKKSENAPNKWKYVAGNARADSEESSGWTSLDSGSKAWTKL